MNDAGTGFPEADAVLRRGTPKKFVDLFVQLFGACEIDVATDTFARVNCLSLDQVVAVDCRRNCNSLQPCYRIKQTLKIKEENDEMKK